MKVLPRWPLPAAALVALLGLAGCGGTAKATRQTVSGQGFSFQAPLAWHLTVGDDSAVASSGAVDLVEAVRYRLEKAYEPDHARAAALELDGIVERLAGQMHARLAGRSSVDIAGFRTTDYRLVYGRDTTLEIAFFLRADTEYELLCRRRLGGADSACSMLFSSFAPA